MEPRGAAGSESDTAPSTPPTTAAITTTITVAMATSTQRVAPQQSVPSKCLATPSGPLVTMASVPVKPIAMSSAFPLPSAPRYTSASGAAGEGTGTPWPLPGGASCPRGPSPTSGSRTSTDDMSNAALGGEKGLSEGQGKG